MVGATNDPTLGYRVIVGYRTAEDRLEEYLRYVPYCKDHENVWSPELASILFDIVSQLNSLWKHEWVARNIFQDADRPTITDYHSHFSSVLVPRPVIFWEPKAEVIAPFKAWKKAKAAKSLFWWDANNGLKHSRLTNQNRATLSSAVHALAGLFLSILRYDNPSIREAFTHAGWLKAKGLGVEKALRLLDDTPPPKSDRSSKHVVLESRLFTYAPAWRDGCMDLRISSLQASYRFDRWLASQLSAQQT